jgi:hypothetical protein
MSHRLCLFRRATSSLAIVAFAVCLVWALPSPAEAAENLYLFRAGVHNSREHPLTQKQLQKLIEGLRFWTGLTEITIDGNEQLSLGNRSRVAGGSITARELIIAAVDGRGSFILENRSHSPTVAFAQIDASDTYIDAASEHRNVWRVRIDFYDFTNLRGEVKVIAAFDPAINFLHELAHGVRKYSDAVTVTDRLGECEKHINRMRAEIGMPERQTYYPRTAVMWTSTPAILQAELIFIQIDPRTGKKTSSTLKFSLEQVCSLDEGLSCSAVRRESHH